MWSKYCLFLLTIYFQKKNCFQNNTLYKFSQTHIQSSNLNPIQISSTTNHTTSNKLKKQHPHVNISFQLKNKETSSFTCWKKIEIILCSVIFTIGVIGNAMLITAIIKDKKLHTLQNYFILNLAFADLLILTVVMPTHLCIQHTPWPFGTLICQYLVPFYDCIPAVSIFTLVVVSYDRYRIIVFELSKSIANKIGVCIIIFLWILSYVIVGLPLKFVMKLTKETGACYADWRNNKYVDLYYISRLFILNLLPTLVIFLFWFHVRKKLQMNILKLKHAVSKVSQIKWMNRQQKIVTVFFVIFIVFVVCYFPFQLITIFSIYWIDFKNWNSSNVIVSISVILVFINAITNPIILYTLSKTFRQHFQNFLPILGMSKKKNITRRGTTQTIVMLDYNTKNLHVKAGRQCSNETSINGTASCRIIKKTVGIRKPLISYKTDQYTTDLINKRDASYISQV